MWDFILFQLKVSWSFPNQSRDFISVWWIRDLDGIPKFIWHFLSGVIGWDTWKERNNRIPEDNIHCRRVFLLAFISCFFFWASITAEYDEIEWYSIWSEIVQLLLLFLFFCFLVFTVLVSVSIMFFSLFFLS